MTAKLPLRIQDVHPGMEVGVRFSGGDLVAGRVEGVRWDGVVFRDDNNDLVLVPADDIEDRETTIWRV